MSSQSAVGPPALLFTHLRITEVLGSNLVVPLLTSMAIFFIFFFFRCRPVKKQCMAGDEPSASARWLSFCRPCSHIFGLTEGYLPRSLIRRSSANRLPRSLFRDYGEYYMREDRYTWEGGAWVTTRSSPARSGRSGEHSRSNVLNVELRPGSPAANRRGKASTTHTRPAESLRTLKPWPKPWAPLIPTRTPRSTHISPGGPEHSSACIFMHHH
jgi:hypothetical protein